MADDLELTDDEVNKIASEAVKLIQLRSDGDRAAQLSAAMGTLMAISRNLGSPDSAIVRVLDEMYNHNPRTQDA